VPGLPITKQCRDPYTDRCHCEINTLRPSFLDECCVFVSYWQGKHYLDRYKTKVHHPNQPERYTTKDHHPNRSKRSTTEAHHPNQPERSTTKAHHPLWRERQTKKRFVFLRCYMERSTMRNHHRLLYGEIHSEESPSAVTGEIHNGGSSSLGRQSLSLAIDISLLAQQRTQTIFFLGYGFWDGRH
jgi:hypothetical protein